MAEDRTFTVIEAYGKYFQTQSTGKYSQAGKDVAKAMEPGGNLQGEPPIPLEKYIEIEQAVSVGTEHGEDPVKIY